MKPPAGGTTAREEIMTTRPPLAASMWGTTARAAVNAEVRFIASIRSQAARSVSTSPPPAKPPTPVTRTSSRPCLSATAAASRAMAASSVTSQRSSMTRARVLASSEASSRARSASTIHGTHTAAPSARKRWTIAWPSAPLPPVTRATRGMGSVRRGRGHHDGRPLDLVIAHLGHVEVLERFAQPLERLLERRQGLARARQRRGPGEQVVLHVRMVDAALLDLGHHLGQHLVGRAHHLGALDPLLQALAEAALEELVHPAQDRREGAAGEALVLLVEQAEGDEVRGLELQRPIVLGGRRLLLGQRAIHPDDLQRLLLQVVRLLGVEGQHLEGHLLLGHEDGGDVVGLQLVERRPPVIAVRRPVHA